MAAADVGAVGAAADSRCTSPEADAADVDESSVRGSADSHVVVDVEGRVAP